MYHIVLESGFEADIDESLKDNMELVDILAAMDDGSTPAAFAMSRLCNIVLGKQQKKALYDHLREENGVVPTGKVEKAIAEIFEKVGTDAKN